MRIVLSDTPPAKTTCDLLALPGGEPGTLAGDAAAVDQALGGRLAEAAKADGFTGKRGRTLLLHTPDAPFRRVLLIGTGRTLDPEGVRRFAAVAVRRAREVRAGSPALAVPDVLALPASSPRANMTSQPAEFAAGQHDIRAVGPGTEGGEPAEIVRAAAEGAGLGAYRFDRYRRDEEQTPVEDVRLCAPDAAGRAALDRVVRLAEVAVEATCRARDLVNEPGNVMTPTALAGVARDLAGRARLGCRIIELDEARTMGMGLFAAVAAGSAEPPKFIVLDYRPDGADVLAHAVGPAGAGPGRTVALVGKGITFDSGGLSIKSASGMATMKGDMAGAAAVIAAMGALRDLGVPVRVLGIAAATENMISGRATRPGDVVRGLGGKTVEINNTDAEGRLVLADGLAYAAREGADEIIDLATLTGSCVVALGDLTAGLMGNDQPLADRLLRAAHLAGEQLWQLPLYEEFFEAMRGEISDLKNWAGREGGAERAAAFMGEFVGGRPWAHLDIAGPAFNETKLAPPYMPQGGTGYGVRTLLRYLEAPR